MRNDLIAFRGPGIQAHTRLDGAHARNSEFNRILRSVEKL